MKKLFFGLLGLTLLTQLTSCGSKDDQNNSTPIINQNNFGQDPAYARCGTISYDPSQSFSGQELILMDSNGRTVRLVPEDQRAFHSLVMELGQRHINPGQFGNLAGGFNYSFQYGIFAGNTFAASTRQGCVYSQNPQHNTAYAGGQFHFASYRLY